VKNLCNSNLKKKIVNNLLEKLVLLLSGGYALAQGWANYGPLRDSMRPAEGIENAKKNEVTKNICVNIIKPSKMKAE
jgi:hypothetical protein